MLNQSIPTESAPQIRHHLDQMAALAEGIAHEFNNILTIIMGNVSLLKSESEDFTLTQKNYIEETLSGLSRAKQLIKELHLFEKVKKSRFEIIDLADCINEVIDQLRRESKSNIELINYLNPQTFYIEANKSEISRLFLNLGRNAYNAIEMKGACSADFIRIEGSMEMLQIAGKNSQHIHITFEDSGVGIPAEHIDKIFFPFYKIPEGTKIRKFGLGLPIVYDIVTRKYKGFIKAESPVGIGTKFHIYLPPSHSIPPKHASSEVQSENHGKSILIVDDELGIVKFLDKTLSKGGYSVSTAIKAQDALTLIQQPKNSFDLIILDLKMPEMSGEALYDQIRTLRPSQTVLISSGSNEIDNPTFIGANAVGFIQKPFTASDITQKVEKIFEKNKKNKRNKKK